MNDVLSSGFADMTAHFQTVQGELDSLKNIAAGSFEIIKEMHYLDGIENIDSAHAVFFSNTKDMDRKISQFESHRFELEKQYMQHLNPTKIGRFLNMLKEEGEDGPMKALDMYNYVLAVEAKYLQMMCVFHINNNDMESLGAQYELFGSHYTQLTKAMVPALKLDEVTSTEDLGNTTKLQLMVVKKDQAGVKGLVQFLTKDIVNYSQCYQMEDGEKTMGHISAIWLAAKQGDDTMLQTLVDLGAIANNTAVEETGAPLSCLQAASQGGHLATVSLLLELGANTNNGLSCLLAPCREGNEDMVAALLEAGEDPNMSGAEWITPLEIAQEKGHEGIVDLLKAHGAQVPKEEKKPKKKEKKKQKEKEKYPSTMRVSSNGLAASHQGHCMGTYTKVGNEVQGKPVWKMEGGNNFLYYSSSTFWMISQNYNSNAGFILSGQHGQDTVPERGWKFATMQGQMHADDQLTITGE